MRSALHTRGLERGFDVVFDARGGRRRRAKPFAVISNASDVARVFVSHAWVAVTEWMMKLLDVPPNASNVAVS